MQRKYILDRVIITVLAYNFVGVQTVEFQKSKKITLPKLFFKIPMADHFAENIFTLPMFTKACGGARLGSIRLDKVRLG
jgi:hypothetical protein